MAHEYGRKDSVYKICHPWKNKRYQNLAMLDALALSLMPPSCHIQCQVMGNLGFLINLSSRNTRNVHVLDVLQWLSPWPSVPQGGPPPQGFHQKGGYVCFRRHKSTKRGAPIPQSPL